MKATFYFLMLFVFSVTACSDDELSTQQSSASSNVTGLTRFKVSNLSVPPEGLPDGKRFYVDGSLRSNTEYDAAGVTAETKNGIPRVRFYVNPTAGAESFQGTEYPYHYRSEFTRYPWNIRLPLGTEEWIGFSYIFPTKAEGYAPNQTPVSIYQNHGGRVEGQATHPPAFQLEIAFAGQLKSPTDPHYNTPLGGEIMIVNNVRGIRFVAPGVRVVAGARLDIVMQIVYGLNKAGLFNVWINGKLMEFQGNATVAKGNIGSTVWPENPLGGNSKFGIYHHMLKHKNGVDKNSAGGHTSMEMWMTDWNDVFRKPGDWDYKNINAFQAVSTASYQ